MALNAPVGGNAERELIEAGSYFARCVQVIQVGTVVTETGTYAGKKRQMIRIVFELVDMMKVFSEEKGPQPVWKEKEYTFSMYKDAELRKHIENWRGKAFTDEEAAAFDISKLLTQACLVGISHKNSQSTGKPYDFISSVGKAMSGVVVNPLKSQPVYLSYEDWNDAVFLSLPEWLRKKMEATPEFKDLDQRIQSQIAAGQQQPQYQQQATQQNQQPATQQAVQQQQQPANQQYQQQPQQTQQQPPINFQQAVQESQQGGALITGGPHTANAFPNPTFNQQQPNQQDFLAGEVMPEF